MFRCIASYWMPMLRERGELDELTFRGGEIICLCLLCLTYITRGSFTYTRSLSY